MRSPSDGGADHKLSESLSRIDVTNSQISTDNAPDNRFVGREIVVVEEFRNGWQSTGNREIVMYATDGFAPHPNAFVFKKLNDKMAFLPFQGKHGPHPNRCRFVTRSRSQVPRIRRTRQTHHGCMTQERVEIGILPQEVKQGSRRRTSTDLPQRNRSVTPHEWGFVVKQRDQLRLRPLQTQIPRDAGTLLANLRIGIGPGKPRSQPAQCFWSLS